VSRQVAHRSRPLDAGAVRRAWLRTRRFDCVRSRDALNRPLSHARGDRRRALSPLLALTYFETEEGAEELEIGTVSTWAEPAPNGAGKGWSLPLTATARDSDPHLGYRRLLASTLLARPTVSRRGGNASRRSFSVKTTYYPALIPQEVAGSPRRSPRIPARGPKKRPALAANARLSPLSPGPPRPACHAGGRGFESRRSRLGFAGEPLFFSAA
jgi:hypothetical protein